MPSRASSHTQNQMVASQTQVTSPTTSSRTNAMAPTANTRNSRDGLKARQALVQPQTSIPAFSMVYARMSQMLVKRLLQRNASDPIGVRPRHLPDPRSGRQYCLQSCSRTSEEMSNARDV